MCSYSVNIKTQIISSSVFSLKKVFWSPLSKAVICEKEFHAGPSLQETVTYQLGMQSLLDRSPHDGDGGAVMLLMMMIII